jgi:hypothetical protein
MLPLKDLLKWPFKNFARKLVKNMISFCAVGKYCMLINVIILYTVGNFFVDLFLL